MEDLFITYDQAVTLKELGFDEPCFGFFIETGEWIPASYSREGTVYPSNSHLLVGWVSAPLKQQAIMFLLNKSDDLDETETSIEYFGDESGSINRHIGFGTLNDAIQILIDIIKNNGIHF